mgnify:CR=1 FL=1
MLQISKVFDSLFEGLNPRQREVITGRFGLDKTGKPQTLAALGSHYGVTRERIRQIETLGLEFLKKKIVAHPVCAEVLEKGKKYLKDSGGVTEKKAFLDYIGSFVQGLTDNHLALLLEASGTFHFYPEDKYFKPFYYLDKPSFRVASTFINQWASFLNDEKEQVLAGHYEDSLEQFLKRKGVPKARAVNYLNISKRIGTNPYNDMGLAEWPEIAPRTIRDHIYLVLKKKDKPLHFRTIAKTINEDKLGKRLASAPTVHNELIKDDRFVLVGRGIYALAERGYEPGNAREVIHRILKKQGPLRPREIILAIQKERFFKPNTILVNLQNKSFFERLPDGNYRVREA